MVGKGRDRSFDGGMGQTETRRELPMLDNLRVASPCSASWAAMKGDARVRFCGQCDKNVYNLSAMTRHEAQALIVDREGEVCVRLYRRKDGTVINADCAVGTRRKRVTRFAAAAMALGGAGVSLLSPPVAAVAPCETAKVKNQLGHAVVEGRESADGEKEGPSLFEWLLGDEDDTTVEMGDIAEPPEVMMGAVSATPPPAAPPETGGLPQL